MCVCLLVCIVQTFVDKACVCNAGLTLVQDGLSTTCFRDAVVQSFRGLHPDQRAAQLDYKLVVTGSLGASASTVQVASDTFLRMFTAVSLGCQESGNSTACQALGNLCVLTLYDKNSEACKVFLDLARTRTVSNNIAQWSDSMPWLYFATDTTETTGTVSRKVSFNPRTVTSSVSSRLDLVLATYSLSGEWLGFKDLTDSFQLCPPDPKQSETFLLFGHEYVQRCNLDLLPFLTGAAGAPAFFDPYLRDEGGALIPVKVKLLDYTENSVPVNDNSNSIDDVFVRRFFLFDNVSGKRDLASPPQVVRIASSFTLTFTLNRARGQAIYPPVLTLRYSERLSTDVENYVRPEVGVPSTVASRPSLAAPTISFNLEYTMSVNGFLNSMLFLLITLLILTFLAAVFKLFFLIRRTQSASIDLYFLAKMVLYIAEVFSRVFFWMILGISFYWYIFFKWQDAVYVLLPRERESSPFFSLMVACFVASLCHILHLIYKQCNMDVFFIDWEKTRGRLMG